MGIDSTDIVIKKPVLVAAETMQAAKAGRLSESAVGWVKNPDRLAIIVSCTEHTQVGLNNCFSGHGD